MQLPRAAPRPTAAATPPASPVEGHVHIAPVEGPRPADRPLPPPPMFLLTKADDAEEAARRADPDEAPTGLRPLSSPYGGDVSEPPDEPATRLREPSSPRTPQPHPTATAILMHNGLPMPTGPEDPGLAGPAFEGREGDVPGPMADAHHVARVIPDPPPPPTLPPPPLGPGPGSWPTDTGGSLPRVSEPRAAALPVGALAAGGVVALVVVLGLGTGLYFALHKPAGPAASASASTVATGAPAASTAPKPTEEARRPDASASAADPSASAAGPSASAADPSAAQPPASPGSDEAKARATLERLKTGIETCVSKKIHVLPGTSPAVPDAMAWLKHGPYASLKRDWVGPFFACTGFRMEEPMPFMLQWQVEGPKRSGTAVVWLDDDHDGKADRAFGFTAHWKQRDVVSFDPVVALDPSRPIAKR